MSSAAIPTRRVVRLADKTFQLGQTVYWYSRGEWRWGTLQAVDCRSERPLLEVRSHRGVVLLDPDEESA